MTVMMNSWSLSLIVLLLFHSPEWGLSQKTDSNHSATLISEGDLQALLAMKRALVDPKSILVDWNNQTRALACSGLWVGVKCSPYGQVVALLLPRQRLGGYIAAEIGHLLSLRKLNLHSNLIDGTIPPSLASLRRLQGVYLFGNRLSGSLPNGFATGSPHLRALDLSRNLLSGSIPDRFTRSLKLTRLDLSFNSFSGNIPPSLSALSTLKYLSLGHNLLQGDIPGGLGLLAQLQTLDLSTNGLTGTIPDALTHLSFLTSLILSSNQLSGALPETIDKLAQLQILDISNNKLTGHVPLQLGNMTGLATLDLSRNNFSGLFPASLGRLINLASFNCSMNQLEGPVPPALAKRFDDTSFEANPRLCAFSIATTCSSTSPLPFSVDLHNRTQTVIAGKKHKFIMLSWIFIVMGSLVAGILLLCLIYALLWRCGCLARASLRNRNGTASSSSSRSHVIKKGTSVPLGVGSKGSHSSGAAAGGKLVRFYGSLGYSADDLLCATAEVLGKSSYGTTYKATLENGHHLAVKRLREGCVVRSQQEFESEVGILGSVRHRNLLTLKAFYWGPKEEKLLVYDYMPAGSLATFLHARGPESPIGWQVRIRIAVGVANGLAYLHDHQKMIHGNLTSSNILLDARLNPLLSDFGLSRIMSSSANAMGSASAVGYRAPELSKPRKASTKSDVYSFGIVLLELLTGKAPGEAAWMEMGMELPEWVASTVKEEWTSEIFDLDIMKVAPPPSSEDLLISTLQLAMDCVSLSPSNRPDMGTIVHHLNEIVQPAS